MQNQNNQNEKSRNANSQNKKDEISQNSNLQNSQNHQNENPQNVKKPIPAWVIFAVFSAGLFAAAIFSNSVFTKYFADPCADTTSICFDAREFYIPFWYWFAFGVAFLLYLIFNKSARKSYFHWILFWVAFAPILGFDVIFLFVNF